MTRMRTEEDSDSEDTESDSDNEEGPDGDVAPLTHRNSTGFLNELSHTSISC